MNRKQKELLDMCKQIDNVPELQGIYILPTTKKHDSGYKIMYIVGYFDDNYYLLDTICDVVDFENIMKWDHIPIRDIHIDMHDIGIIHIWSNYQKFKIENRYSSCTFAMVDKE